MDGCPNPYCEDDGWVSCEGGPAKGRFRVPCRHPEHPCRRCNGTLWLGDAEPCPECNPGTETVDENTGLPLGVPA